MTLALGIMAGAAFGLVLLSAFFSGSETALTTSSRPRLHELEKRGERRARTVLDLKEQPERLIGGILLGNNLVNILASALATSVFLQLFGESGVIWATLVMTALVLVFGEVLPKTYAIVYPERFSLAVSGLISMFVKVFAPVVMGVEVIVKNVLSLAGVDLANAGNILSPQEEIRGAIDLHHKEGAVVKNDRDMLGGVLDLSELELSDLMIHRTKMFSIDVDTPNDEIISDLLKSGFSRAPVWQDNPDNIIGVLHAKDVLSALQLNKGDASKLNIKAICSKAWFVPDTTTVNDQLSAFLRRKSHFSLVVDEYGEVMGLVTLEDILEEIVGDIADEHDVISADISREASGSMVVNGSLQIRDLNRANDWQLPDDEANTIAGLVIHEAQMIPEKGQAFTFHGFRFEVAGKKRNQITRLRITPLNKVG
ncbi:MAG: HlyC/CorC family transporter [Pseudomonadota bacterium]